MKRGISFVLAMALLLCLLPVAQTQAATITYPVTGGNIYISEGGSVLKCDDTVTEAVIPAYVDGVAVTSIGQYAFRNKTSLTKVVLPEGITYVGSYAFEGCGKLSYVDFPSTLKKLPQNAFASCGFTSLNLEYIEQVGTQCFYNCRSLKTLTFGNVDLISSGAFMNCYDLAYVTFPETLTYIYGKAFYDTSIRSVVLPASISYIGEDAFGMNINLTRVTVLNPGCRYAYYDPTYSGGEIFHGLTSTTITYHGEENSSLRKYVEEFGGNYTAHSFNDDEVCTTCGAKPYTFDDGLWSFDSRSGVAYIYGCGEVAEYTALYEYYDWRFYNSCVKHIVLGNDVREVAAGAFSDMYMVETINLVNVERINRSAFENCTAFERLYTPDTLIEIKDRAFAGCTSLVSVVLRPNVSEVGANAFKDCTSLTGTTVLNPNCELVGELGVSTYNTIFGFIPSTAYDFATRYNHPFVELNGCEYGYHSYALVSETPAGCTSAGECVYQCQNCTEGYTETVPALGHSYEASITEPSCVAGGFTTYTCQNCFDTYTAEQTEALGHEYESSMYEPSCTEGGYTEYSCPRCGDRYTADYTEPDGHHYTSHTVTPTCTEGGYTEYFCTACGDVYVADEVTPKGHDYGVATTLAPTCTEGGYSEFFCMGCGDRYVGAYTGALGHQYAEGCCAACGTTDPDYKPEEPVEITFIDVYKGSWYEGAVEYAVRNKLMVGMAADRFEPETATTRAMLVTVLWRYVGQPLDGKNNFRDVPMGKWFTDAVAWAAYSGIVTGVGNGCFAPETSITREQLVTILYRYCNSTGIDTSSRADLDRFPDADKVSSYAEEALSWAVSVGLVSGTKLGGTIYLDPQGEATRAQVASILMRFIENIAQ